MNDRLLTPSKQKEAFSEVYIRAVAAGTGYITASESMDLNGIDIQIRAGQPMRPSLDVQLKATSNLTIAKDGLFRYPLETKDYDRLRETIQTPRILVVLDLPDDEYKWLAVTPEKLVIRNCAYYLNLRGFEESFNKYRVTVKSPRENRFNVESLRDLMDQSRRGKLK